MITYLLGYFTCCIYLLCQAEREDELRYHGIPRKEWPLRWGLLFEILGSSITWPVILAEWLDDVKQSLPLPPKPSPTGCPEPMGKVKEGVESHD